MGITFNEKYCNCVIEIDWLIDWLINVKRQVSSISAILMTRTINVWEYQR
jgi:hypothetical protein